MTTPRRTIPSCSRSGVRSRNTTTLAVEPKNCASCWTALRADWHRVASSAPATRSSSASLLLISQRVRWRTKSPRDRPLNLLDVAELRVPQCARRNWRPIGALRSRAKRRKRDGPKRQLDKPVFAAGHEDIRLERGVHELVLEAVLLPTLAQDRTPIGIAKRCEMTRKARNLHATA